MSVTGRSTCVSLEHSVLNFGRPDQDSQIYWLVCPDGSLLTVGDKRVTELTECGAGLPVQVTIS